MIGILVILGVSWLLLFLLQKKNLAVLGFLPLKRSILCFLFGLFATILISAFILFLETQVKSLQFTANSALAPETLLNSFWYHFKSALTEELIYRGAILYILIQRIGAKKAICLSAVIFGVYHWFSYKMFGGDIIPMIYILLITGSAGFVWAYAYEKTDSIMIPLGLHLGSNFFSTLYLPNQPYGELLYSISGIGKLSEWNQLLMALLTGFGPPILMFVAIKLFLKFEQKFSNPEKALT